MTLHIELDEEAEVVHILVDDHLSLRAEKRAPFHIVYRNFDALIDDPLHLAVKNLAGSLLNLSNC